ncbi:alpha/beta fold hydrolase [Sulfobacillus thermotolerans]|uniref:alpha/beta fold hydrolase n=1 Tax=Sulfobacillus thermotolerans TaxID=338644 RepID=UPI003D2FDBDE
MSESRLYGIASSAISPPVLTELYPQANVVSTKTIRTHYYTDNPSIVIPGSNQNLVIFLHGGPIGCWHNTYNPIAEALSSQGFHVILFNSSGSNVGGKSRFLAADYGRVDLHELFQAFCEMTEDYPTSAIHIVGDSYGGYLAWLFAIQMQKLPRRIRSLVILNGFMSPDDLQSDNPAVRVLKKCLPNPAFRRPDVDKILFVTSRNDRLICSVGIELNCSTMGIPCKVMNSGHQISDT